MYIELEEEQLQTTCIQMRRVLLNLEGCMKDLDQILGTVGNQWQGEAEVLFEKRLLETKKRYQKILISVGEFEKELTQFVNDFTDLENESAARILQI